uniref:Uncharacterized protein n=1 Tax=Kalanchoe fedtschenkoi TaxID=63787 RepID=A0A7N1A4U7_KALFE
MATVQFISRSTVQPSSSSSSPTHSKRRIDLSQWDTRLLFIHYIQHGLIYPRHQITATVIQSLKSSLSRVLNFFYPLAGRLAATDNKFDRTTSFRVECNDAGVEFVHAKADDSVTVAQVMECVRVPSSLISSLFGLNGVKNVEGVSKPLLSVQVTELVDGLFLACSVNHAVADGTSFWHFLSSWSQISRGMETISIYPDLQRAYSGFPNVPIWVDIREETQRSFTPPPLAERVFHFTADNVMKLKLKARAQISPEAIQISALQSVLAHVWRAVVVANSSHLDAEDEVQLRIPINWRPRLEPPLSDSFFGNAMHSEGVACKVRDVTDSALGHLALKVNRMVASQKDAVAKEFLQKWMEGPNLVSLSHASKYMTIMFGSPRFDVYGMDFGWGRPVGVRSGPANKVGGTVRVYPCKQDGSVDTEVSLPLDALNGMGKDEKFMKFVSQE